jgi:hypothetical protein
MALSENLPFPPDWVTPHFNRVLPYYSSSMTLGQCVGQSRVLTTLETINYTSTISNSTDFSDIFECLQQKAFVAKNTSHRFIEAPEPIS